MGNRKILEICKLENGKLTEWNPKKKMKMKIRKKKENNRKSLGDYDVSRQEVEADGERSMTDRTALWFKE